mgnify:CR=1 FL=1
MTTQFHDHVLSDAALAQLFNEARSYNGWLDKPVSDEQLHAIWDLMKMAKAKLVDCVSDGNKKKVAAAPVTAVIGYDIDFHEELPWLFPHTDAKSWFDGDEEGRKEGAFRNSSLQGAYLMLAARAVGLDCGPMSGFDKDAVNAAFFADEPRHRVNFICSVGYGDPASIFDRSPRPEFATFNRIA